jgi:hypothetical protein
VKRVPRIREFGCNASQTSAKPRKHIDDPLDFRFEVRWPDTPTGGGDALLDASVGRLSIGVQDVSVTAFQSDKGDIGTELTIPMYDVAEWIASNWWPLLFEPRKTDLIDQADDDAGYRSRHWLGYARSGFALPDLWFYPVGDEIEVCAYSKYLRYARVTFLNKASANIPTEGVRGALANFVEEVVQRLKNVASAVTEPTSNAVVRWQMNGGEAGLARLLRAGVDLFWTTQRKSRCEGAAWVAKSSHCRFQSRRRIELTGGLAQPSQPRASKWAPSTSRYPLASSCAYWRLLLAGVLNQTDDA